MNRKQKRLVLETQKLFRYRKNTKYGEIKIFNINFVNRKYATFNLKANNFKYEISGVIKLFHKNEYSENDCTIFVKEGNLQLQFGESNFDEVGSKYKMGHMGVFLRDRKIKPFKKYMLMYLNTNGFETTLEYLEENFT